MADRRLIDANALPYTRVRIFHGMFDNGTPCVGGANAVVMSSAIRDAPTIDAVEVVRCKDCKHRLKPTGMCMNPMAMGFDALEPTDFDFCSRGEREDTT